MLGVGCGWEYEGQWSLQKGEVPWQRGREGEAEAEAGEILYQIQDLAGQCGRRFRDLDSGDRGDAEERIF